MKKYKELCKQQIQKYFIQINLKYKLKSNADKPIFQYLFCRKKHVHLFNGNEIVE